MGRSIGRSEKGPQMNEQNEGSDFGAAFGAAFGSNSAATAARSKLDRRSGMSTKQRARKAQRTEAFNMRASPDFKLAVSVLAAAMDCTMADAMHEIVFAALKSRKLTLPGEGL
jgi:hypothetical protein